MDFRKHFLEAITLIAAAVICAVTANAIASRERKIVLVGTYPNATKVPQTSTAEPPTLSQPAPAPVAPVEPTTTTVTALTTTTATTATVATPQPRTPATPQPPPPATQKPSTPATTPAKPDLTKFVPHPDKAYIEIPYADVAALHAGGATFFDARRTNVYEQGHIAGAKTYSVWESDIDDKVRSFWESHQDPKEQAQPIVVYCSGGDCDDSHMLAQKLWGAQFNNVYVYKDGFPDWQAKGGAIHTGANP